MSRSSSCRSIPLPVKSGQAAVGAVSAFERPADRFHAVSLSGSPFPAAPHLFFHQPKINLPVLQINPLDTNLDRVTQSERPAVVLSNEGVLSLVVDIIVVMKIADVDQSFH